MRRWVPVLVVSLGLLLTACGSAAPAVAVQPAQAGPTVAVIPYDPSATPTPTPSPTPTPLPTPTPTPLPTPAGTPVPQLWSAELRYADVPSGWSRASVDSSNLMDSTHFSCDGKWMGDPVYYTTSAGIQFLSPNGNEVLVHALWQSATVSDARKEMTFYRSAYACSTWDILLTNGADVVYHVTPLALPQYGDESVAVRMTSEVSGKAGLTQQIVYLRIGSVLSEVTVIGSPQSNTTLLASLATTVVQRIHAAGY
ncbi:MAG TPA: hypothetical protein VFN57_15875 [Thermomicrobiaceae bacterium]|nr:hypothetical protein [Thermomicrobiaceae bacterium]